MRFTIRDIIWLTLVVALILGWVIDRRATVESHRQLIQELHNARVEATRWRAEYTRLDIERKMTGPRNVPFAMEESAE